MNQSYQTTPDYKQEIEEILIHSAKYVGFFDDTMKKTFDTRRTLTVDIPELTQALTHLINKAREKDLQKYLDQMREIMAENFHYRTICGDIKDPSGKLDINELFIKYQELEPEREKFANYVEDRIKELEK